MLSQDELNELREAMDKAVDDDVRHPAFKGHPQPTAGCCGVVATWLQHKLGGYVGTKNGHFFWISPDQQYALDLTGDQFPHPPTDKRIEGLKVHEQDEGLKIPEHQKKWRPGPVVFKFSDHPLFKDYKIVEPLKGERVDRFIRRANHHFDNPHELTKTADWTTDAYPGDSPQATEDYNQRYFHDDVGGPANGDYNFIFAGGQLEVSPFHTHDDLLSHAKVDPQYKGPLAVGTIQLLEGSAFWSATGNVSPKALIKTLKNYSKVAGWSFGGLTDINGVPIDDELFMGKNSRRIYFTYSDGTNLVIAHRKGLLSSIDSTEIIGYLDLQSHYAKVQTLKLPTFRLSRRDKSLAQMKEIGIGLLEWCQDNGYILLGAHDNVIKTIEDLDQKNLYDPNPTQPDDIQYPAQSDNNFQNTRSEYACPVCNKLFGSYSDMLSHTLLEEGENPTVGEAPIEDSGMKQIPDSILDNPTPSPFYKDKSDFTTEGSFCPYIGYDTAHVALPFNLKEDMGGDQYLAAYRGGPSAALQIRQGKVIAMDGKRSDINWLLLKLAFENPKAPEVNLSGPLPFIYDIEDDTISFGQPGTTTSAIDGQFSPGGIVDGYYEPDGKIVFHTFTNMPYSVNHFLQLFYQYQKALEVKSVWLYDDGGGKTKLAAWS